jgi:hypothetical protein
MAAAPGYSNLCISNTKEKCVCCNTAFPVYRGGVDSNKNSGICDKCISLYKLTMCDVHSKYWGPTFIGTYIYHPIFMIVYMLFDLFHECNLDKSYVISDNVLTTLKMTLFECVGGINKHSFQLRGDADDFVVFKMGEEFISKIFASGELHRVYLHNGNYTSIMPNGYKTEHRKDGSIIIPEPLPASSSAR